MHIADGLVLLAFGFCKAILNFSCFLAQLFFMVSEKANYVSLRQIIKDYIFRLYDDLERIQSNEDKSIILALREYDKVMED